MSKLIDADKLKASVAEKYVRKRKTKKEWWEESLNVMETIDSQPEVVITCCKCHGYGFYDVYEYDENDMLDSISTNKCELCNGAGKITLEFYEKLQKGCRR